MKAPRDRSSAFVGTVARTLRRAPYRIIRNRIERDPVRIFVHKSIQHGVETILDIGANVGQFATEAFRLGWPGEVLSFEPIAQCHRELVERSLANPRWHVMEPMCLGSRSFSGRFLQSANSVSSSLLPATEKTTSVAQGSDQVAEVEVTVRSLDELVLPTTRVGMKLDVQGYELEVLRGAEATLSRVSTILVEISLADLYEGAPSVADLFGHLERRGFRCVSITEGFSDRQRHEVLQVDGCFVRN